MLSLWYSEQTKIEQINPSIHFLSLLHILPRNIVFLYVSFSDPGQITKIPHVAASNFYGIRSLSARLWSSLIHISQVWAHLCTDAKASKMQHFMVQAVSGTSLGRETTERASQWHTDVTNTVWFQAANKMKSTNRHQTHNRNTVWTKRIVFKEWLTIYTSQACQQKCYISHMTVVLIGCHNQNKVQQESIRKKKPHVIFDTLIICFTNKDRQRDCPSSYNQKKKKEAK